jgi:hypothetical protein
LTLNLEEINKVVNDYDLDSKAIKDELFRICWYMRGGITASESMMLSFEDREIIARIVEKNLQTTKESGLPFF